MRKHLPDNRYISVESHSGQIWKRLPQVENVARTNAGQRGALTPSPALTTNLVGGPMAIEKPTVEMTCAQCGVLFLIEGKPKGRRFCTKACRLEAWSPRKAKYDKEWRLRPKTCSIKERTCRTCGQLKDIAEFNRSRTYADNHKTECRACEKAYRQRPEQKERHRKTTSEWKRKNPDKIREYTAKAREANTERHRKWRYANPDKWAAVVRTRSARKRACAGYVSSSEMYKWTAAQKKVCHWCGVRCAHNFHVDHIMPLKRGGGHELRNLCIACPTCNSRKNAKHPIDFAREMGKLL